MSNLKIIKKQKKKTILKDPILQSKKYIKKRKLGLNILKSQIIFCFLLFFTLFFIFTYKNKFKYENIIFLKKQKVTYIEEKRRSGRFVHGYEIKFKTLQNPFIPFTIAISDSIHESILRNIKIDSLVDVGILKSDYENCVKSNNLFLQLIYDETKVYQFGSCKKTYFTPSKILEFEIERCNVVSYIVCVIILIFWIFMFFVIRKLLKLNKKIQPTALSV